MMIKKNNIPPLGNKKKQALLQIETLIEEYKSNVELMNMTQQIAIEATNSVIQLQTQYMKQVYDQLSE